MQDMSYYVGLFIILHIINNQILNIIYYQKEKNNQITYNQKEIEEINNELEEIKNQLKEIEEIKNQLKEIKNPYVSEQFDSDIYD